MTSIRERIGKEWLVFDGGSGTILQSKGLRAGEKPEEWNLSHPDEIRELAEGYFTAGADIVNANTFGANRLHYPDRLEAVIKEGIRIAKEARSTANREDAYVALDIGPTGKLLAPMGDLSFDEAVDIFAECVRYGVEAGADLIVIETMTDSYEAKAAILAAKENSDLPIICTTTYDENGKMLTGGTVESTVALLEGLGVDALGVNCSLGPRQMLPIVKRICACASIPVAVNPNAGLPETRHGRTVYPVGAEEFASLMKEIAGCGIQMAGGCCGTTPAHIRALKEVLEEISFQPNTAKHRTVVTSYALAVEIAEATVLIGERINPTGKKKFKQALQERDFDYILSQGLQQEDAGAQILDVNVGLPGIDEAEMMESVVTKLQAVTTLPLQIDTSDIRALERAMRIYNGKPMINSVNGKLENMEAVMPLVKKYGGVLVGLPLDEEGIPDTADGRIAVAKKIFAKAESYGISQDDLVIDGLAMTISSDNHSAVTTLETIRRIKEELHGHSVLGVSNISFGLPQRQLINSNFLSMAMLAGLSAAILNVNNEAMMCSYRSAMALLDHDAQCSNYIDAYADAETTAGVTAVRKEKAVSSTESLKECVIRGLVSLAPSLTEKRLQENTGLEIINSDLIPALDEVGKGFEAGTVFLPQMLMSSDAAKAAFAVIRESMKGTEQEVKGRMILATVKGDIHDIGKNIVKVMLENYGFEVLDLGKDVAPEVIVETAVREDIRLVGLSALMTTTVVNMEETIRQLREAKPETKIIVGGAVLTEDYAAEIGADAYGRDAMATVRYAEKVFGIES